MHWMKNTDVLKTSMFIARHYGFRTTLTAGAPSTFRRLIAKAFSFDPYTFYTVISDGQTTWGGRAELNFCLSEANSLYRTRRCCVVGTINFPVLRASYPLLVCAADRTRLFYIPRSIGLGRNVRDCAPGTR